MLVFEFVVNTTILYHRIIVKSTNAKKFLECFFGSNRALYAQASEDIRKSGRRGDRFFFRFSARSFIGAKRIFFVTLDGHGMIVIPLDRTLLNGSRKREIEHGIFVFSFYTRGMSFVDMAYLRKKDLSGKVLSYRRRKTGQLLYVHWERCMQDIVKKYSNPKSPFLLPIIRPENDMDQRRQYIYVAHKVNRCLKLIGQQLGLSISLTMYVSRHAWASIAHSKNIPLSVISEGMGHNSEATTRIYLATLDTAAIDKANKMILRSL